MAITYSDNLEERQHLMNARHHTARALAIRRTSQLEAALELLEAALELAESEAGPTGDYPR